jgi:hypothetical protein
VTHVFLNPVLTAGTDFDRQPGDDGIVVVIEPRNRDDAFVPLAGPISVLVLDPAKTPEEGRIVARWDIDATEAQRMLVDSPTVRGIQLRLPWPARPPQTSQLHLYVRYLTVDHRDLRADRELFITLPGQYSQRWTPRAAPRSSSEHTAATVQPHAGGSVSQAVAESPTQGFSIKSESAAVDLAPAHQAQARPPEWRPNR